ncbi:MAG: DUF4430 domain-containing protein [Firmicutes bacterium]|nr:DUF4430 domain-containing protein [Bacillota bacterium]
MSKRRLLSLLLCLLMLVSVGSLSSCGSDKEETSTALETTEEVKDTESANTDEKTEEKTEEKTDSKSESKPTPSQPAKKYCTISIEGWCSGKQVEWKSGDTVYSILVRSGAPIETQNSVYGVYIVGIADLREGDKGAGSGWVYTVNGATIWDSVDGAAVNAGDTINWSFTTNGFN